MRGWVVLGTAACIALVLAIASAVCTASAAHAALPWHMALSAVIAISRHFQVTGSRHFQVTGSLIFGILGTDITSRSLSPVSVSVITPPIVVGNGCQPHTVGIGHGYATTTTTIECLRSRFAAD